LLEARNPAAKALSSEMELSTTVPHPAEELCRLAVQAQEVDEQVKKSRSASSENKSVPGQMVTAMLS
jgi:hypothetical protein